MTISNGKKIEPSRRKCWETDLPIGSSLVRTVQGDFSKDIETSDINQVTMPAPPSWNVGHQREDPDGHQTLSGQDVSFSVFSLYERPLSQNYRDRTSYSTDLSQAPGKCIINSTVKPNLCL